VRLRRFWSVHPSDITLSGEVGGLGLIDRENAALINSSLRALSGKVVTSLRDALGRVGIRAPLYFSQNDGTLVSTEYATRFPIVTCSAGPTNSIRGAAFLTGIQDAIVMDIGGTTTDLGFLVRGFPRETATAHLIGGVRTNFRMPDVCPLPWARYAGSRRSGRRPARAGLGGIRARDTSTGLRRARTSTTTDVAVRAGQAAIGDPGRVKSLGGDIVTRARSDPWTDRRSDRPHKTEQSSRAGDPGRRRQHPAQSIDASADMEIAAPTALRRRRSHGR